MNDMPVYKTLNDAARIGDALPEFEPGKTEIWYAHLTNIVTSQPLGYAVMVGYRPTLSRVRGVTGNNKLPAGLRRSRKVVTRNRDYSLLGKIACTDLERIFAVMQGEIWSPQGQARNLIRFAGLSHTSMSVGDVVVLQTKPLSEAKRGEIGYICCPAGWEPLLP